MRNWGWFVLFIVFAAVFGRRNMLLFFFLSHSLMKLINFYLTNSQSQSCKKILHGRKVPTFCLGLKFWRRAWGNNHNPKSLFFPYVAKSIQDRVGCILFEPCHVWAIFTQWFTFSKGNHGENICRQLSGCSTIWWWSNPIFFLIYFASVTHVSNVMKEKIDLIMGESLKGFMCLFYPSFFFPLLIFFI